jgi:exosortase
LQSPAAIPSLSWRTWLPPMAAARLAVIVALLAFVYWEPIRHTLVARWISDGNWSHGWLIPIFSLYFLYTRRDALVRAVPNPTLWGVPILLVSFLAFFYFAWWARMAYPQAITIVPTIIGLVLLMGGWNILKVVWFPVLFLGLAVPLPHRTYFELTTPMRILASKASAAILPLLIPGLHTDAQAVVIDYMVPGRPAGQLNVEEACSGMRLLMAFVTLGIAIAYLGDRPTWQRIVLVAACLPIALFCNIVRVTTTGYLSISGHQDLAQGTAHQLLGLAMLVLALGLFSLLGYVLSHLFVETADDEKVAQPI